MVKGLFEEVQTEFSEFIKEKLNKEISVELSLFPKEKFMKEEDLGGVILYCRNFKIVYDNSLRARCELCFNESIPDIREKMFVSLK